jgi:hypothetical protein
LCPQVNRQKLENKPPYYDRHKHTGSSICKNILIWSMTHLAIETSNVRVYSVSDVYVFTYNCLLNTINIHFNYNTLCNQKLQHFGVGFNFGSAVLQTPVCHMGGIEQTKFFHFNLHKHRLRDTVPRGSVVRHCRTGDIAHIDSKSLLQ